MPRMIVWKQDGDIMKQAFEVKSNHAKDFSVSDTLIEFSELDVLRLQPVAEALYQKGMAYMENPKSVNLGLFMEYQKEVHDAVNTIGEFGELYRNLAEATFCELGSYYWSADTLLSERRLDYYETCTDTQRFISVGSVFVYLFMYTNAFICEGLQELAEKGASALATMSKAHCICQSQVTLLYDDGALTESFEFDSTQDYFSFLFLQFLNGKKPLRKCACCGRLFVPASGKNTKYCDRVQPNGKTCKQLGPAERHRRAAAADPVIEAFDRTKRKMYKRMERTEASYGVSSFPLDMRSYYEWLYSAEETRKQYLVGEISAEAALKKLEPDKATVQNPLEYIFGKIPVDDSVAEKVTWWQDETADLLRQMFPNKFADQEAKDSTSGDASHADDTE